MSGDSPPLGQMTFDADIVLVPTGPLGEAQYRVRLVVTGPALPTPLVALFPPDAARSLGRRLAGCADHIAIHQAPEGAA